MEANELRIGNYFDHNGRVDIVNPNTIAELFDSDRKWIKPIPLTEEWLVKFGFKRHLDTIFLHWSSDSGIFEISTRLPKGSYGLWTGGGTMGCFEHVHQLQNLYFALTGQELTQQQNP